tara:strand:+ start:138 stop:398 length:261 start_codon:yes stop_codon:yes gene_type:complete
MEITNTLHTGHNTMKTLKVKNLRDFDKVMILTNGGEKEFEILSTQTKANQITVLRVQDAAKKSLHFWCKNSDELEVTNFEFGFDLR